AGLARGRSRWRYHRVALSERDLFSASLASRNIKERIRPISHCRAGCGGQIRERDGYFGRDARLFGRHWRHFRRIGSVALAGYRYAETAAHPAIAGRDCNEGRPERRRENAGRASKRKAPRLTFRKARQICAARGEAA